jgi:hypothetical protein
MLCVAVDLSNEAGRCLAYLKLPLLILITQTDEQKSIIDSIYHIHIYQSSILRNRFAGIAVLFLFVGVYYNQQLAPAISGPVHTSFEHHENKEQKTTLRYL